MKAPFEVRFWAKVRRTEGCWLWTASLDGKGYGQFHDESTGKVRNLRAHRVAYELVFGPIPKGMCILHICDCPQCVNPDHLRLGSMSDNTQDMLQKNRDGHGELRGSQNPTSKFTELEVGEMRENFRDGTKTISQMAREHRVTYQSVWYAIHKGWKHVE